MWRVGNPGSQIAQLDQPASPNAKTPAKLAGVLDFNVVWLPAATTVIATAATAATATTTTATATTTTAIATTAVAATTATITTAAVPAATTPEATAATTAAAASAAAEAAAATTTAAAVLALLGLVDAERATVEGPAVHTLDRLGGFLGGAHGHEREAARAARFAVRDQVDIADRSEFLERGADAFSIGVERKVSNVQTSVHRLLDLAQKRGFNPPQRGPCSALKRVSEWISDCFPLSTGGRT